MQAVFVTHNELGIACLEELSELGAEIKHVFTRPRREDISDQTDIGAFADNNDVPLSRVSSVNTPAVQSTIQDCDPDILFIIGWSQLVDTEVLEIPNVAALGMHPAPLPRGRGRAPLAWSLIKGLDETALSFFHLVEAADAGDIVGQQPLPIDRQDDAQSMYDKMVEAGRTLIQRHYTELESGTIPRQQQDHSAATWWPKREPHHGLIDWTRTPEEVYNWIRGQTRPYPGAYSYLDGDKITIWKAEPPASETEFVTPGEIAYRDGDRLGVGSWEGIIDLTEVQVGEDTPLSAGELVSSYRYQIGDQFQNARDPLV
ncbi:methionyl-tRNA formyltransferase [Halohasta litchfieldiae]|jgi:methionyl-tRNA formyltransferase|uniref:Methionyl-tRNA formyltransferase n=1 Tax=Halohasta litchfieldiae TaxID=1073996 RepID=A0A1H6Y465_9EURY|nr:methionyl-tRNA formyltransferase [Halohasta litchfieldiae]SEJ36069.1 methionyl-tRNA formyltransferase [Halohasta litchfieldiae]